MFALLTALTAPSSSDIDLALKAGGAAIAGYWALYRRLVKLITIRQQPIVDQLNYHGVLIDLIAEAVTADRPELAAKLQASRASFAAATRRGPAGFGDADHTD